MVRHVRSNHHHHRHHHYHHPRVHRACLVLEAVLFSVSMVMYRGSQHKFSQAKLLLIPIFGRYSVVNLVRDRGAGCGRGTGAARHRRGGPRYRRPLVFLLKYLPLYPSTTPPPQPPSPPPLTTQRVFIRCIAHLPADWCAPYPHRRRLGGLQTTAHCKRNLCCRLGGIGIESTQPPKPSQSKSHQPTILSLHCPSPTLLPPFFHPPASPVFQLTPAPGGR